MPNSSLVIWFTTFCRISLSVLGCNIYALMQYYSYRCPCNNLQSCVFPAVHYWSTSKFIALYIIIILDFVKKLTANPSVLMYYSRNVILTLIVNHRDWFQLLRKRENWYWWMGHCSIPFQMSWILKPMTQIKQLV